ncbi:MAG: hypothetical protein RLZZ227_2615 [Pseudomonadota bacterium]|jgi:type II secretory pathway predicted ATPase ExeA
MYLRLSPYQDIIQGILTDLEVNEGIVKLTGKSGAGKTALCTQLRHELQDKGQPVVLFLKPPANATELQNDVLGSLGLVASSNFTRTLTAHLIRQANPKPLVLIFDDAHLLDPQTFSAVRMLCNVQNQSQALIRVILCGNEELDATLATPALRAVAQFLSQSISLTYLTPEQTLDFCQAYWQSQGADMKSMGEKEQQQLYQETQGHPGILHARLNQGTTGTEIIERGNAETASDAKPRPPLKYAGARPNSIPALLVILALVLLGGIGAWFFFKSPSAEGVSTSVPADVAAPAVIADAPESTDDVTQETSSEIVEAALDSTETALSPDAAIATDESADTSIVSVAAGLEATPEVQLQPLDAGLVEAGPTMSVEAFLADWAQHWQSRDVDAYLESYDDSFVPPQGLTRSAWEEQRRNVIGNAQDLVISVDLPEFNNEAQDGMRFVRFWLNYRSATYADRTLKEVLLVPVNGTWRIRVETNLRTERQ